MEKASRNEVQTERVSLSSDPGFGMFSNVVLIIAALFMFQLHSVSGLHPCDDAYMTLKSVKNILLGHGFIYNLGEPVYCTTTALYVLAVSLLCWITGLDALNGALLFNQVLSTFNVLMLYFVAARGTGRKEVALLCVIIFCGSFNVLYSSTYLMETPLFLFMILLCLAALLLEDTPTLRALSAVSAGLAMLTRPEGVVLCFCLCLYRWIESKKLPWLEGVCILLVSLPWFVYAWMEFGTIIPQSMPAKELAYIREPMHAIKTISFRLVTLFVPLKVASINGIPVFLPLLALSVGTMLIGFYCAVKQRSPLLVVYSFVGLTILLYALKNPPIFIWYIPPFELAFLLLFFSGAFVGGKWLAQRFNSRYLMPFVSVSLLTIIVVLSSSYSFAWALWRQEHYTTNIVYVERETLYKQVAHDFLSQFTPSTTVLAPEFGALGYYSSAKMLSSIAQINPSLMQYFPIKEEEVVPTFDHAIPVRMVQGELPDYIVSLEIFIRRTLLESEWFMENYEVVKVYPATVLDSRGLYVFRRKDLKSEI